MKKIFEIVSKATLGELETLVNTRVSRYREDSHEFWEVEGAPFYDAVTKKWNQSIKRTSL